LQTAWPKDASQLNFNLRENRFYWIIWREEKKRERERERERLRERGFEVSRRGSAVKDF